MLRDGGAIVGGLELGLSQPRPCMLYGKMRLVGLVVERCGKAVGPSCDRFL